MSGDIIDPKTGNYYLMYFANDAGQPEQRPVYVCYGINSKLTDTTLTDPNAVPSAKLGQLRPASFVALMVEKRMAASELATTDPNYVVSLAHIKVTWKRFAARHNKGGNILFADGHVQWVSNQDANTTGSPNDWNQPGKLIWNPFGIAHSSNQNYVD